MIEEFEEITEIYDVPANVCERCKRETDDCYKIILHDAPIVLCGHCSGQYYALLSEFFNTEE